MTKEKKILVPVEISARHIHLTQGDIDKLFGEGYKLTSVKKLSQAEDFAAQETVDVEVNGIKMEGIRIVGEPRDYAQLEISATDSYKFKTEIPFRLSSNIEGTPGLKIFGPNGEVEKKNGVIVAKRHLHASPQEAEELNLKNGDEISVICSSGGERETTFHQILVRVQEGFHLSMHIDTDEANAAGMKCCGKGVLLNKNY